MHFPDQIYIEQIRKHLWSGREFGRAAVMVGAGFSKNAEKVSGSVPNFPLWNQIAGAMFDALYPVGSVDEGKRQRWKASMTSGAPLRLVSEYEAAFTRASLDDLLIGLIPDNGYRPGNLHKMLLSLPWADVFTTNYDTLLERTRPYIHDRKYDEVLSVSDIPVKSRPRIVKLHGSFPSQRPFIITEEDFRTYPRRFSPFVNLVQQSIMENVFCLLGFSGEDPNFLNWSGWVRDHLGDHVNAIYLCGILDISAFQRKLLEGRKIIPVDLSPLFPESELFDRDVRHAKAMEWFLLTLLRGEPPNDIHWPKPVKRLVWQPSERLPEPLPGPPPLSPLGDRVPKNRSGNLTTEELLEVYQLWEKKRDEYPGWVVAPKDNREKLWDYTEYWFEPVLDSIGQVAAPENLFLLYELNWRLEKTLTPYPQPYIEKVMAVVDQFNPFPKVCLNKGEYRPDKSEFASLPWQRIASCWIELNFAAIRTWRENLNGPRFLSAMETIKEAVKQQAEWQSRWYYEYCLFFLAQSDFNAVRARLPEWKATPELPFWETKRASILAETGELAEARQIAENALAGIRSQFIPGTTEYSLMSQEGWAMMLLRGIRMNRFGEDSAFLDQLTDRGEKLAIYHCNPWIEVETLETIVKGLTPFRDIHRETRRGYHPKDEKVTYHMLAETAYSKLQPAFNFLRMFEEGGIPIRSGSTAFFQEAVLNAANCITAYAPAWSLSSRLRAAADPEKENWLDLATVAGLSVEERDYLYQVFRNSFVDALNHLARHPEEIGGAIASTAFRRATTFAELLSRLCPCMDEQQVDYLLQLAVEVYPADVTRNHHSLHKCQTIIFKRALEVATTAQKLRLLPTLLSLPIVGESGFEVSSPDQWDDPFRHFSLPTNQSLEISVDRSSLTSAIKNLIRIVEDGSRESRWRAILRLSHLYDHKILTAQEIELFTQALWSKSDDTGLPETGSFWLKTFVLHFPEPQPGIAKEKLKAYLLSKDFYRQVQRVSESGQQAIQFGFGITPQPLVRELCQATPRISLKSEIASNWGIEWSEEEIILILRKAVSWWDDQKDYLSEDFAFGVDNLRQDLSGLVDVLMKVILPRIGKANAEHHDTVIRVMTELERAGIAVFSIWPLALSFKPEMQDEVARRIQSALFSNDREAVERSLLGIRDWVKYSVNAMLPLPPNHLLDQFISIIATRRQPGLDRALLYLNDLIQVVPEAFEERHLESILLALDLLVEESDVRMNIGNIETPDKPHFRSRSARLAYLLSKYYQQNSVSLPRTIKKWQEICSTDTLFQVRKAWGD